VRIPRLKRRERQALPARRSIRKTRGVCTPLLHVHTRRTRTPADSQARPQLAASAAAALAAVINGVCWPGPPHTRTRTCRVSRYEEFLKVPVRIPADPDATIKTRERQCAPAASVPGLGPPLPHLHRDWARPSHICPRTGLAQPHLPPGPGSLALCPLDSGSQRAVPLCCTASTTPHYSTEHVSPCDGVARGPLWRPSDRQAAGVPLPSPWGRHSDNEQLHHLASRMYAAVKPHTHFNRSVARPARADVERMDAQATHVCKQRTYAFEPRCASSGSNRITASAPRLLRMLAHCWNRLLLPTQSSLVCARGHVGLCRRVQNGCSAVVTQL
jgi:hypothetical protein